MNDLFINLLYHLVAIIITEAIAIVVFGLIRKKFGNLSSNKISISILRGILERLVVYIGLSLGIQSIVILFGALKIATKIKADEENEKISNTYFLVGNFMSILIVLLALLIYKLFIFLF